MPPRKWRTLTTCAALLLATTSCALGPTIRDAPKQPAAATADAGARPTVTQTRPGGPAVGGPPGATPPLTSGSPVPTPSAVQKTYVFGGGVPFVFDDGMTIEVLGARIDRSLAAAGDLIPVVIQTRILNGSSKQIWAYRLDIHVLGCGQPVQRCNKIDAPASAAEARKYVQPGATETVDWFVGISPEHAAALTVVVRDPKSGSAEFTGSAA